MASSSTLKPRARTRQPLDGIQAETWHPTTPADVIEAYTKTDGQEGWEAWTDYLGARTECPPLAELLPCGGEALIWAMPQALRETDTADLVSRLGRGKSFTKRRERRRWTDEVTAWLDAASVAPASRAHAYECLAWAYALPRLPLCVGESLWWKLLEHLVAVARDARQVAAHRDPLLGQLVCGELPLALAYLLPEISACNGLAVAACSTLSSGLSELIDVTGVPQVELIGILPSMVACWVRSRAVAENLGDEHWQEADTQRFEAALATLARLSRPDRFLLLGQQYAEVDRELWKACESFKLTKPTHRIAKLLAGDRKSAKRAQHMATKLPSPALHSEESQLAVLRTDWSSDAPRLAVSYAGRQVQLELNVGGTTLFSGDWQLAVAFEGQSAEIAGNWETICWYSDDDVDFLEIEAPFGEGLKAQRQLLLAREDHVLLVADAILAERPGRIDYTGTLPVCESASFTAATETREGRLDAEKVCALTLPLALPEWRVDLRRGSLESNSDVLTLIQHHQGKAAYAPLFFDFDSRRAQKEATWRQLNVAELRQAQPLDAAAGFRAQSGKSQWLVYRSLTGSRIRSVLGQHVSAEFLFGRIKSDGGCKRLLEIEPIE